MKKDNITYDILFFLIGMLFGLFGLIFLFACKAFTSETKQIFWQEAIKKASLGFTLWILVFSFVKIYGIL